MKIHEVVLDGSQYSKLDFMVSSGTSIHMARNHLISGFDLFYDLIDYIYACSR